MFLEVRNLKKYFKESGVLAVDDVSFSLEAGRTLGMVGESGSGKSTMAKLLLRLLSPSGGEIIFRGQKISSLKEKDLGFFRKKVQIIFQNPFLSLDPRMKVEAVLKEPFLVQGQKDKLFLADKLRELLGKVSLPEQVLGKYSWQLSGGECQRVAIARVLAPDPELIICDEPISSLDALVGMEILELFRGLQKEKRLSFIFISHDLLAAKYLSDFLLVMKDGRVCEYGPAEKILRDPREPYTKMLVGLQRGC